MRKILSTLYRFPVFTIFIVLVTVGIFFGMISAIVSSRRGQYPQNQQLAASQTEATAQYQSQASEATKIFFDQARVVIATKNNKPASWPSAFAPLVSSTKSALVAMRVPADMRTTHLSLVLLLDKWQRAIDGSSADQKNVFVVTTQFLAKNPWLP